MYIRKYHPLDLVWQNTEELRAVMTTYTSLMQTQTILISNTERRDGHDVPSLVKEPFTGN